MEDIMRRSIKIFCFVAAMLAAVAGSFSTLAQAQEQLKGAATEWAVNPGGVGHALVIPYFSTQSGNSTLVNIVNSTWPGKVIKVRVRGAANGDSLFDFQVFLKANDMWTMNLSTGADGIPVISTDDESCTLPAKIDGQKLRTVRLSPTLTGDDLANHAREGYIEIINMGDIWMQPGDSSVNRLWLAIRSPACDPSVLDSLVRFDPWLSQPTTGLYANWTIINVPQTTVWSGEATAWEARDHNGMASTGNLIYFPQKGTPLSGEDVAAFSADALFSHTPGTPVVAATENDLPDLSTPSSPVWTPQTQANALSHAIDWNEMSLEHLIDSTILAVTDFAFSMPTRRYYWGMNYTTMQSVSNHDTYGVSSAVYFRSVDPDSYYNIFSSRQSVFDCLRFGSRTFDREGRSLYTNIIQPAPVNNELACGAVGVVHVIGAEEMPQPPLPPSTSPLHASVTQTLSFSEYSGLDAPAYSKNHDGFYIFSFYDIYGIPIIARSFIRAENPNARPGVSGTFGVSVAGRITRRGAPPPK
jgi:hypothetical protein